MEDYRERMTNTRTTSAAEATPHVYETIADQYDLPELNLNFGTQQEEYSADIQIEYNEWVNGSITQLGTNIVEWWDVRTNLMFLSSSY